VLQDRLGGVGVSELTFEKVGVNRINIEMPGLKDPEQAIKLIRESEGKADAAEKLMKAFKLDQLQADAILDAQLYRIAQLEIKKILTELREKKAQAAEIEGILQSNKKLWGVVKKELHEVGDKYADKRRTRMASGEDLPDFEFPQPDLVDFERGVLLDQHCSLHRRLQFSQDTRPPVAGYSKTMKP